MQECTVAELNEAMQAGATVIDVREVEEYIQVHVPGVELLPLSELPERLNDVPTADPLYIICRSGSRSITAGEMIAQARQLPWVNVAGGTTAWIDAGFPVESGMP